MKKLLIVLTAFILLILVGYVLMKAKEGKKIEEAYPDNSIAPILRLTWSETLNPKDVTRYTPYGIWENTQTTKDGVAYEPANEMQFYIKTDASDFLAVAPGIVTQNETHSGSTGLVSIKFGANYVITYLHIIPSKNLKIGDKVETGDVIGKMEKAFNPHHGEETWWEIQLSTNRDGIIRTLPPYDYFDRASQDTLDKIAENSKEIRPGETREKPYWTISKGCSWIQHTGEPEWWDSNRFGGFTQKESEKEFIKNLNPDWRVADNMGNIIGPSDICN